MSAGAVAAALIGCAAPGIILDPVLVGSIAWSTGTSVTPPDHQAGDYLVALAMRNNSGTGATVPGDFIDLVAPANGNSPSLSAGYKIAASEEETCTGWTNAQSIYCAVFRNVGSIQASGFKTTASADTAINHPGLTLTKPTLILSIDIAGGSDSASVRSDVTQDQTHTLTGSGGSTGDSYIGLSTGGIVLSWGALTVTKTGANARAIGMDIALESA